MVHVLSSEPPRFPDDLQPEADGLVAVGGDLSPETLTEAYCKGIFPWSGDAPIPWYSPDPRLVLFPSHLRVSRSLRQTFRSGRYEIRFDHDFEATIRSCAESPRADGEGTWISPNMVEAYIRLHELGIAHSVEAYENGALQGGLYGVSFGRGFFGESMFARARDASKVALHALCEWLLERRFHFIDCQQVTPHLVRLGAVALPRAAYLDLLRNALAHPSLHETWRA